MASYNARHATHNVKVYACLVTAVLFFNFWIGWRDSEDYVTGYMARTVLGWDSGFALISPTKSTEVNAYFYRGGVVVKAAKFPLAMKVPVFHMVKGDFNVEADYVEFKCKDPFLVEFVWVGPNMQIVAR